VTEKAADPRFVGDSKSRPRAAAFTGVGNRETLPIDREPGDDGSPLEARKEPAGCLLDPGRRSKEHAPPPRPEEGRLALEAETGMPRQTAGEAAEIPQGPDFETSPGLEGRDEETSESREHIGPRSRMAERDDACPSEGLEFPIRREIEVRSSPPDAADLDAGRNRTPDLAGEKDGFDPGVPQGLGQVRGVGLEPSPPGLPAVQDENGAAGSHLGAPRIQAPPPVKAIEAQVTTCERSCARDCP